MENRDQPIMRFMLCCSAHKLAQYYAHVKRNKIKFDCFIRVYTLLQNNNLI